jgi:hypothetical protein
MTTTLARNSDPATSHLAAREHLRSSRPASQKALILDAIREHPGICAPEIAKLCGWGERNEIVSRRMKSYVNAGLVVEGPVKEWGGAYYLTYRMAAKAVVLGEQERLL